MITTQNPTRIFQAESLFKAAWQLGHPSAVWRLPNRHEVKLLISLQEGIQRKAPDLEELPACFLLHPFEPLENGEALVLEGDLIFTFSEDWVCQEVSGNLGQEHPFVQRLLEVEEELADENTADTFTWAGFDANYEANSEAETHFRRAVTKAVATINRGDLTKVVLSRTKTLAYSPDFQPFKAFQKLCVAYPSAFVSLVNLSNRDEMWLGATPETLVALDESGTFRTASLAGTQTALQDGETIPPPAIRWGQKEIQEQALVSRYIIDCFKKIRLREYLESGPRTVRAGNLYHLQTDFAVNTQAVNFPELGTVMLKLLHPTSAVCGMPKEPAMQFIKAVEGYDRSFYSGYLGPVNVAQESALFVNLRTLRLADGKATFFAGAGITEDSDPQGEEVLLPNRYVTDDMRPDDRLRVFVYTDSEDRPVATTEKPLALRDEFAYLKVVDVNNSGAFLAWGLTKDLFVPFSEQLTPMERGEKYLVFLYLDRLTSRMLASPRLNRFVENERLSIAEGDEVNLIIWERTDLGYNVIVNEFHKGLVFESDIFKTLHIGDRMKGYVKKIREENKLDITLEKIGIERFEPLIQRIVDALKNNDGFLPIHDDSPPEEISKILGMSKRNFKKSIGSLWKSGIIEFEDKGIRMKG